VSVATLDFSTPFGRRVRARLKREAILWLTTVDATGTPQPRPIWFHWNGADLLIFSQPEKGKLRHIARNPHVSLHFNSDEAGNDFAVFVGEARVPARRPAKQRVQAYLRKYRSGIRDIGMTPKGFFADYSVPILVRLTAMRGW
jgi:PPOX class probable F420-dependent enzyme